MIKRGFQIVENWARRHEGIDIDYPKRSTTNSSGYDFYLPDDVILVPNTPTLVWTDIKAYMLPDEFLGIYIRSSIAIKKGIIIVNQTGIVDSDYYNNSSNDGNIIICLMIKNKNYKTLKKGERVAQGIFQKYLVTDDDYIDKIRDGGLGSTK